MGDVLLNLKNFLILLFSINLNVRILDVFERNYAGHIEDCRALALSICGAVMLWGTAGADKAADFAGAKDSINTIAFTRKDTIGRSLS